MNKLINSALTELTNLVANDPKSENVQKNSKILTENIEIISENDKFYNLPSKTLQTIITKADFSDCNSPSQTIKRIFKNYSSRHKTTSTLILNWISEETLKDCEFSFKDYVDIISGIENSPICKNLGTTFAAYNQLPSYDYTYDIKQKKKEIEKLQDKLQKQEPIIDMHKKLQMRKGTYKPIKEKPKGYNSDVINAAMNGFFDSVRYAMEVEGVKNELKNDRMITLLHAAAVGGHLSIVQYLVEYQNCNINARDINGQTPLHYACENGKLDVVKYFCEMHNQLEPVDNKGETPLYSAARNGHLAIVKYLVKDQQVNINSVNNLGDTFLYGACISGNMDLIRYIMDDLKFTIAGQAPLFHSCLHGAAMQNNIEVIKYFLNEVKIPVDIKDQYGYTPILYSIFNNRFDAFKYLLENGADPKQKGSRDETLLMRACSHGTLSFVKYLIEHLDYDLKAVNTKGETVLHLAAKNGKVEICLYLVIQLNCDKTVKDNDGKTPADVASREDLKQLLMID